MTSVFDAWETVIGLECHVQLDTSSKLFSPAPNRANDPPNTNVDVVDLGLPGVLPVPNRLVFELATRLALAVGARIRPTSVFARKHYFYPDLPKGYQISQFDEPFCEGGAVTIETDAGRREIPLTRIHIEEDAGKSIHGADPKLSHLDFNRAGTPLLEVVSEPALRTPEEATAYLRALRQLVMYLGICDGNLQEGSMRADANVSVRRRGTTALGTRTETKNLNSPRFLGAAIAFESRRQILALEHGETIVQETRLWDPDRGESRSMRTKEDAHDYRYFPDPDLLPVVVSDEEIARVRASLPELPAAKVARYTETLGVTPYDARVLTQSPDVARYFEDAIAHHDDAKAIANWVLNEVLARAPTRSDPDLDQDLSSVVSPRALAALVALIDDGTISGKIAKDVFQRMVDGEGDDPRAIVARHGLVVEKDAGKLAAIIDDVIAQSPAQVAKYKGGAEKILGFFVGQVMKATQGRADPAEVNRLVKARLDDDG